MPRNLLARAIALGVVSVAALGPFIAIGLYFYGASEFARQPFLALKSVFSAIEGAAVTPVIVLAALLESDAAARECVVIDNSTRGRGLNRTKEGKKVRGGISNILASELLSFPSSKSPSDHRPAKNGHGASVCREKK